MIIGKITHSLGDSSPFAFRLLWVTIMYTNWHESKAILGFQAEEWNYS